LGIVIESVLFDIASPITVADLADILSIDVKTAERELDTLAEACRQRGIRVQRDNGFVQMVTAPEAAQYVQRVIGSDDYQPLSKAALETLAIIAYKQPITRLDIDMLRGYGSEQAIVALKARGLITEVGRAKGRGRPALFGTTLQFLQHFGLERPDDLAVPTSSDGG
jgi:segregation and condensation protein B